MAELLYLTLSIDSPYTRSDRLSSFKMKGFSSTKRLHPIALMLQTKAVLVSRVLVIKRPWAISGGNETLLRLKRQM